MNYQTIPFVFEFVTDATCIQYVIIRKADGRVFDVCKNIVDASERLSEFLDEMYFKENEKEN